MPNTYMTRNDGYFLTEGQRPNYYFNMRNIRNGRILLKVSVHDETHTISLDDCGNVEDRWENGRCDVYPLTSFKEVVFCKPKRFGQGMILFKDMYGFCVCCINVSRKQKKNFDMMRHLISYMPVFVSDTSKLNKDDRKMIR